MEARKQAILDALDAFTRQRAGLDYRNYCSGYGDTEGRKAYFSEQRSITRDLHDYRELRKAVGYADSITADMILEASRSAFRGRLVIHEYKAGEPCPRKHEGGSKESMRCGICNATGKVSRDTVRTDYCTGQYFPTEYRKAACAVLAAALWYWTRELCMPSGANRDGDRYWLDGVKQTGGTTHTGRGDFVSAGDWLRAHFRQQFGRGIASRYFN
jgi:hypothetical protein